MKQRGADGRFVQVFTSNERKLLKRIRDRRFYRDHVSTGDFRRIFSDGEKRLRIKLYSRRYSSRHRELLKEKSRKYHANNRLRYKEYRGRYYLKNRAREIARRIAWQKKNRERCNMVARRWYSENRSSRRDQNRKWIALRPGYGMMKKRLSRKVLSDCYIKQLVTNGSMLKADDIPQELITLKRLQVMALRFLKQREEVKT